MSRLLVEDDRKLRRLQAHLASVSKRSKSKSVQLSASEAASIVKLLKAIFEAKPIIVDEYLSPNEAAKLCGVSRPVIIEMLKANELQGHKVRSHWKVKRESLLDYIRTRDIAEKSVMMADEDGFGLD